MKAIKTIVLYTDSEVIAEVFAGESYMIPNDVKVFEGTLKQFKDENPDFSFDSFELV